MLAAWRLAAAGRAAPAFKSHKVILKVGADGPIASRLQLTLGAARADFARMDLISRIPIYVIGFDEAACDGARAPGPLALERAFACLRVDNPRTVSI